MKPVHASAPEYPIERQIVPRLVALSERLRSDPDRLDVALELCRALNAARDHAAARAVAHQALDRLRAVSGDDGRGDAGAELWYERIWAIGHADPDALADFRAAVYRMAGKSKIGPAHRNAALLAFFVDDDGRCRRHLRRALELDPRDGRSHEVRALVALSDGDPDELRAHLEVAVKAAPASGRLWKLLADAVLEGGDTEKARGHYMRAVEADPLAVEAWRALGSLYLSQVGDYTAALRCFAHALAINPRYWEISFDLTEYYSREKLHDLARAEVLRILLLDPDAVTKAKVENQLGHIDYQEGRYEDAIKRYRRALTLDPTFATPWHNLGLVHVHQKDYDSAIECFNRAVALDPEGSWSYVQLGFAHLEKKAGKRAGGFFQAALEKNPDEYGAYLGLAELARRGERFEEQLAHCQKALDLCSSDANVRNDLAIAYECNKRTDDAIREYQEALRLEPHHRWAANNLAYLHEKVWKATRKARDKEKALDAWRVRLLICRDTGSSIAGARAHILKLGVSEATFERWLREGRLETEIERVV
ncbi:MAG: tetratricopeptide repeat protein [Acidobacteriota bacterium]